MRQRPSTTNPTSATLLTRPNRRDSDLRISQTTTNALSHQLTLATQAYKNCRLPDLHRSDVRADRAQAQPMSRKVLAFAGAAAFVLGNRSRVEILDLRDARDRIYFFGHAEYDTGVLAVTATPGAPAPGVRGSTARKLLHDCTKRLGHPSKPSDTCECDYHYLIFAKRGCRISNAVDFPGCACYCYRSFLFTCTGVDANCKDPESDACKNPDKSKASCKQGGGDCGGYR